MRLQSHPNLCGPAAVANALRARGKAATEDKVLAAIKKAMGATEGHPEQDGTSALSIQRALEAVGMVGDPWTLADGPASWAFLRENLLWGRPVFLAVDYEGDRAEHWVVAIGVLGDRVLVADSADPELVLSLIYADLDRRWKSDTDPPRYYGMTARGRSARTRKVGA